MRTLLELRDEEQNKRVEHNDGTEYPKQMFIAMGGSKGFMLFNGWFLDPFMNLVESKDMPGKAIYFSDVEMSKIQADFV